MVNLWYKSKSKCGTLNLITTHYVQFTLNTQSRKKKKGILFTQLGSPHEFITVVMIPVTTCSRGKTCEVVVNARITGDSFLKEYHPSTLCGRAAESPLCRGGNE